MALGIIISTTVIILNVFDAHGEEFLRHMMRGITSPYDKRTIQIVFQSSGSNLNSHQIINR